MAAEEIADGITPARRAHHFTPLQVLQHRDVEGLLGHDPLQARVLLLERLQALRLVFLQGRVLDPPAEEGLVTNPQALTHLGDRRSLGLQLLGLPQLGDDLLHAVALRRHRSPPFGLSLPDAYDVASGPNRGGPDTSNLAAGAFDGWNGSTLFPPESEPKPTQHGGGDDNNVVRVDHGHHLPRRSSPATRDCCRRHRCCDAKGSRSSGTDRRSHDEGHYFLMRSFASLESRQKQLWVRSPRERSCGTHRASPGRSAYVRKSKTWSSSGCPLAIQSPLVHTVALAQRRGKIGCTRRSRSFR
jgi:hypothetical protein